MDTDDLSDKTYKAIMVEAEGFNHDLTLQFGLLSYECNNEKEFIQKSKELIEEMKGYDEEELDDMFFGDTPALSDFNKVLNKLLANIATLQKKVKRK
jgi:hypothetical protein